MELRLLPYSPQRDVYRLLQVEPTADPEALAAAWRRLARTFHPDRNRSPRATTEMQVVNAVRELMSDPRARAEYDRHRAAWLAAARVTRHAPVGAIRLTNRRRAGRPAWKRTARAMLRAMAVAIVALDPPRCFACRSPVEETYRFCAACGEQLQLPARVEGATAPAGR